MRAVVPAHIARKWHAVALRQLAEAASRLADECERLEYQLGDAWQMIDQERDINRELSDQCGAQIGMDIAGNVGVLKCDANHLNTDGPVSYDSDTLNNEAHR